MSLICISGSSGVGKTTISKIIQSVLGTNKSLCLSGDDLHRWERNNPAWKKTTHLHPESNNLDMGHAHLTTLKKGGSIDRRLYNHDTGEFDSLVTVTPKPYIIYEGLHALYHKPTLELADVKIFVDTDEQLKTEWKIKRDTKKRGYTEDEVRDTIRRRQVDERQYISPQRHNADIVVKFTKNADCSISLWYVCVTGRGEDLMILVKDFYESLTQFMDICKWLSLEPTLVQGRGGNVSVKSAGGLIIKSSGAKMADVNLYHGFCVCDILSSTLPKFVSDEDYSSYISASKKTGNHNPSMETGFHMSLPNRVVIHTHPIHLNALLCSKESETVIESIFADMSYEFVEYTTPGVDLVNRITPKPNTNIFFLQNHGLVVGGSTSKEAIRLTEEINNRCKRWLGSHVESFVDSEEDLVQTNPPLFPDAAVFPTELCLTNNYILHLIQGSSLTPNFLGVDEIQKLVTMPLEKIRKSLQENK